MVVTLKLWKGQEAHNKNVRLYKQRLWPHRSLKFSQFTWPYRSSYTRKDPPSPSPAYFVVCFLSFSVRLAARVRFHATITICDDGIIQFGPKPGLAPVIVHIVHLSRSIRTIFQSQLKVLNWKHTLTMYWTELYLYLRLWGHFPLYSLVVFCGFLKLLLSLGF